MPSTEYSCGTCGSILIRAEALANQWHLFCGNGHPIIPVPGTMLTMAFGTEGYE